MRGVQRAWPADEDIIAGVHAYGTISAYAEAIDLPRATIASYINRRGLNQKVKPPKTRTKKPAPGSVVSREETLTQENLELRKALASARAEDVREARVLEVLEASIARVRPEYVPAPRKIVKNSLEPHTLALLWSDCHAAETVSRSETLGLNEYSWEIMQGRLRRLADGVRSHRDHYGARARSLRILSLGDQLTGEIHEELSRTNDTAFGEAMVRFGEEGAQWVIDEFGDEFEDIEITFIPGNHPRFTKKPRHKLAYDNGDMVAGHVMRIALKGIPRISVTVPRANKAMVEICNRRILLMHGEGVRSTMVGVPWGGLMRRSERLKALFDLIDEKPDHIFCGHFHTAEIADDFSILVNGSLKGVDEFGIDEYGGGKPPVQLLAAFHPKWGITGVHKIDCEVL